MKVGPDSVNRPAGSPQVSFFGDAKVAPHGIKRCSKGASIRVADLSSKPEIPGKQEEASSCKHGEACPDSRRDNAGACCFSRRLEIFLTENGSSYCHRE